MADKYGLKIGAETYQVAENDPDKMVFSSEYPTLTIRERAEVTVNTVAGSSGFGSNTYVHNYGYIPLVLAYAILPSYVNASYVGTQWLGTSNIVVPNNTGGSLGKDVAGFTFNCQTTSTTITCEATTYGVDAEDEGLPEYFSATIVFKLLICMEKALTS